MKVAFLAIPLALASSLALADTPKLAVAGSLGMMGIGADLIIQFNDKINGRGAVRFGSIDADGEEDGIEYKGSLDLSAVGALIDFHPTSNGFRITGGMFANNNEIDLNATSPSNAEIGDLTYNITDGKVNSNIGFESTAPYLGIGWGNPMRAGSRWSFMADLGVLFQGSPQASVKASGAATEVSSGLGFTVGDGSALDVEFQQELSKEEANLNKEMEDFDMLPVVSVGVSYRF